MFKSFFLGGFECSSHLLGAERRRLDLNAGTLHDRFAADDYLALQRHGIRTVRDGIRWHRIERSPRQYTFADDLPLVRAARQTGTQVIWDICHYGWPEDLDVFSAEFSQRLAGLAKAFVSLVVEEGEPCPYIVPINEISFLSWIGGTEGKFPPFTIGRGDELKRSLVRATIETIEAVRSVAPKTRICLVDPIINAVGRRNDPQGQREAEAYRQAQFAAWDMIEGRLAPELGGKAEYLDVLGVNYYLHNQWLHCSKEGYRGMLKPSHPGYRPLCEMLGELHQRYRRPIFVAETGIEGRHRAPWLRNICHQVRRAIEAGVPVEGICLYPVTDYPGWVDDRHCPTGLLGYVNARGRRPVYRPLADELARQQGAFGNLLSGPRTQ